MSFSHNTRLKPILMLEILHCSLLGIYSVVLCDTSDEYIMCNLNLLLHIALLQGLTQGLASYCSLLTSVQPTDRRPWSDHLPMKGSIFSAHHRRSCHSTAQSPRMPVKDEAWRCQTRSLAFVLPGRPQGPSSHESPFG